MRGMIAGLVLGTCLTVAAAAAQAAPVVSANGFTCTAEAGKNGNLVECIGQFQGATGLFGATGYDIVHVEFTPDNQKSYTYMSETGCLILSAADKSALAVDKSGTKKQFGGVMDAMQWCYTGGAATAQPPSQAPAAQPQQPAQPSQQQQQQPRQQAMPAQPPPASVPR